MADATLDRYRAWFLAAAVYNFVWGTTVIFFPNALFAAFGMELPNYPSLFQAIGMMVQVYGIGYWFLWRDPERYAAFVWIGLLGKLFGTIGFLYSAIRGELPWAFGVTIVANDVIWLPAFAGFAWRYARRI